MDRDLRYKLNRDIKGIPFETQGYLSYVDVETVLKAIESCNQNIQEIGKFKIDIFSLLGMRNLSAFVGEAFVLSMIEVSNGRFQKNPHQDGYPDLLAMNEAGKREWGRLEDNLQDKKPFSPFITGGIEVKATCGSVPTPAFLAKKNLKKPAIGDSRIELLTGYDWKSHHRETNNLLAIFWDFIDGIPTIAAVFYSLNLTTQDWGKIISPKEGGGRTTSVSIMTRAGVKKMYDGWIVAYDDSRYLSFFDKYNKSNRLSQETELVSLD
jgi:hypothetical protein